MEEEMAGAVCWGRDGWNGKWMEEEWMKEWMKEWMNEWMSKWMDGRMDGWVEEDGDVDVLSGTCKRGCVWLPTGSCTSILPCIYETGCGSA